jgi:hypothetical protein
MRSLLRISIVLALGLCSTPLIAQDDAAPPQQTPPVRPAQPSKPPTPTGSIHGFVYCGDTHKPARGAVVMAQQMPSSSNKEPQNGNPGIIRTAMDGSYTIANLAEGDYGVAAVLPGYISPLDDLALDDVDGGNTDAVIAKRFAALGTVSVAAHQSVAHDITIIRGATISGRVLYSDGSPASQVTLSLENISVKPHTQKPGDFNIDIGSMFTTMFTHQTNSTDDEGHFRISGITPATYRVAAVSPSAQGLDGNDEGMATIFGGIVSDPSSLHVYSGDTLHKNAAKTYELRAGDNITGVDIVIPLNAFHQVRGVLSAVDGRAINIGNLTLVDTSDDTLRFNAKVADDGFFTFPTVPSGTYKLESKNAQIILRPQDNLEPNGRPGAQETLAAFADGNTTVIVKDTDLLDVTFSLTEIPVPKNANQNGATNPVPLSPE